MQVGLGCLENHRECLSSMQHQIAPFIIAASARGAQILDFRRLLEHWEPIASKIIRVLPASVQSKRLQPTRRYTDVAFGSASLNMSGDFGSLENVRKAFDETHGRNVNSWNDLIAAYVRHGRGKESFQLFAQMQLEGIMFDKVTYTYITKACASQSALAEGRRLHTLIAGSHFNSDLILGNALVHMYGKCSMLNEAQRTFDEMPQRDVISWNTLIAAYTLHKMDKEALQYFGQMQEEGVKPDKVTFISILSVCSNQAALAEGEQAHKLIVDRGFETDMVVRNAILNMYGKCGSLEAARRVFDKMLQGNVISSNAMISAYVHNGLSKEAFQIFNQMLQGGTLPDKVTVVCILSACAMCTALSEGTRIHAFIMGSHLESDVVTNTALINMYGKCGSLKDARKLFNSMPQRNVISWNAMIAAYAQHGESKQALQLFDEMQREGFKPSKITLISILDGCANHAALFHGKQLHVFIVGNGFQSDVVVGNALVNMYGKCGSLDDALKLFDKMPQRNDALWNAMFAIYAQNGQGKDALQLFNQMLQEGVMPNKISFITILAVCASEADLTTGTCVHVLVVGSGIKSDVVVENALLNLYSKCNCMDVAWNMFDQLPERDVISWTAMIAGYAGNAKYDEALLLFDQMCQEGVIPNKITVVSILSVCTGQAARVLGGRMHALILSLGFLSDVIVGNALVNMYGKCGSFENARLVFDNMPERDTVSWTAIIAAYAQNGEAKEALKLFYRMKQEGVRLNKVTFLSVLSACSHAGLVEEGYHWFSSMESRYGISPGVDHYNSMIDLFGRAGRLDEAEDLVTSMPPQPTIISLMALLGACKYQADLVRGERIAKHAFKLDPNNSAPYVMLANIYSAVGRGKDAEMLMSSLRLMSDKAAFKHLNTY